MDLCSLAIIFVLAGKCLVFETIENFSDSFGGFCQHGLERNTWLKFAIVPQVEDTMVQHCWNNNIIAGKLAGKD